jgi:hypothetical protein
MWIDNEDTQDPYNRVNGAPATAGAPSTPDTSVGAGGGTASPGGTTTAGTAASGTSSNPSTAAPAQTTGPTQNFATVQDYIGANQAQGEDLGQKVTSSLDQSATADQGAIAGAVNNTSNEINSGTVNDNTDLVNEAVATPTAVTNSPDQLNDFLGQWNAAYTGPSSFETSDQYNTAAAANTDAQQKQAEVATPGGQQQLLNSQFGVYGQGNQGLDQALLTNSSYDPALQAEAGNFQNVQDYLTNQAAGLDTAATNAAATTAATKTNTQDAFTNNLTNFQNQINAETTAAQAPAQATNAQYQTDLASGNVPAVTADLQASGATPAQIADVTSYLKTLNTNYNVTPNLASLDTFNPATDITNANAASAQDYANAAAYGQLTGTDYTGVLNPANASEAGTAPNATSGLNGQTVDAYLKSQLGTQDAALLQTPANISGILSGATSATDAAALAQKYVDAATRQGQTYANSPALQQMMKAASSPQIVSAGAAAASQAFRNVLNQFAGTATPTPPVTPIGSPKPAVTPTGPIVPVGTPAPTKIVKALAEGGVVEEPKNLQNYFKKEKR